MKRGPKIRIYRKNTVNITVSVSPIDTTTAALYFTVKPEFDNDTNDTNAVISKNAVPVNEGKVTIKLTPSETDQTAGKYKYDVKLVDTDNGTTMIVGVFEILNAVTLRA